MVVRRYAKPGIVGKLLLQLAFGPSGIAQRHQQMARPLPFAYRLENILGGGKAYLVVNLQGGLPGTALVVQHKTPIRLHRTAEMHQHIFQFSGLERHVDLGKQFAECEADRAIHHNAHGALFVVLAHIGEGFGKEWIRHRRHGDQKVIREI